MSRRSVYDRVPYNLYDGHINRNIRAAMALIDLTKPYIWVKSAKYLEKTDQVEVLFKINGCINITEVNVQVNDDIRYQLANTTDETYCNHLVPDNLAQTIFSVILSRRDRVILEAVVDQNMTLSNNSDLVKPEEFANDPQTHLVKLRTIENYEVWRNGKYINSTKIIRRDVTDLIEQAFLQDEVVIDDEDDEIIYTEREDVDRVTQISS